MQWLARPIGPMVSGGQFKNGIHIAEMETETTSGLSEIQIAAIWEASLSLAFRVSGGDARRLRVCKRMPLLQPTYLIKKLDRRPFLRSAGRSYCDPAALHKATVLLLSWWFSFESVTTDTVPMMTEPDNLIYRLDLALLLHLYLNSVFTCAFGWIVHYLRVLSIPFFFIAEHCLLSVGLLK